MKLCLFCEREFEPKNSSQKYCCPDCGYCWRSAKGSEWEGMNYRQRSGRVFGQVDAKPIQPPKRTIKTPKEYISRSEKRGFVYLLFCENGLYKIGRTKDITKRLKAISRDIPVKITASWYVSTADSFSGEKYLHSKYSSFRAGYEWFRLTEKEVQEITQLQTSDLDNLVIT